MELARKGLRRSKFNVMSDAVSLGGLHQSRRTNMDAMRHGDGNVPAGQNSACVMLACANCHHFHRPENHMVAIAG